MSRDKSQPDDVGKVNTKPAIAVARARRTRSKRGAGTIEALNAMGPQIVAVGASAGGLDALEQLFSRLPANTGATFIVIQHLSPDHKSMMASLLARHTTMPVVLVEDGMPLQPDHVYLIPPASLMHMDNNQLRLTPKSPHGLNLPIDLFFQSLAQQHGQQSIAVILSGTGSDGTRGASSIHDAGGLVIAQSPQDAKFDGMPRSVIATGLVDAILPVADIPARIVTHLNGSVLPLLGNSKPVGAITIDPVDEDPLTAIFHLLRSVTGINFSDYKSGTVQRRIERRMMIRQVSGLAAYRELLAGDREELALLGRELLIPVTRFFRDPEAFEALKRKVVDPLVAGRAPGDAIRIWCAGVATGEEAYSVAMMFLEAFETLKCWPGLKIFATDVDPNAIETAAAGSYPDSARAEMSTAQLDRFFTHRGDRLQVRSELRQCIVFAKHNLLSDPPFTKMDLVICRNALIYFRPDAQERVLRRLQYALSNDGYLFLGPSESLASLHTDFRAVSARHKLWQMIRPSTGLVLQPSSNVTTGSVLANLVQRAAVKDITLTPATPVENAKAALLKCFAPPPAVLVGQDGNVRHFFGNIQQYLAFRAGEASLELVRILQPPMIPVVAALLFRVARERDIASAEPVRIVCNAEDDDGPARQQEVRLTAIPVADRTETGLVLLVFEKAGSVVSEDERHPLVDVDREALDRISALENELMAVRETLQATIEALETSNEELQATNEELMASNEELQSSNEELQSVNEELNTVNAEYQEKIEILNGLNVDLDSMSKASSTATIFLDNDLNITRLTEEAKNLFRLRGSDIGRPLADFSHKLHYPEFHADLRSTLAGTTVMERQVTGEAGEQYLVRLSPYRVPSASRTGVVVTFTDTTLVHRASRLQSIIDGLAEHIAVLRPDGVIEQVNEAWREFARANGDRNLSHCGPGVDYLKVCEVVPGTPDAEWAQKATIGLRSVLFGQNEQFSMEYPCHSPTEQRWFVMNVRKLRDDIGGVIVSHVNVTSWYNRDVNLLGM